MLRSAFVALALLASAAQAAPERLTEAKVRAFVAQQSRAWNDKLVTAWALTFTPDARFTDQGRAGDGRVVPYGTSTLAQASAQAKKAFAASQVQEQSEVSRVTIAPDGKSAQAASVERTTITEAGKTRTLCAERAQTLVLTPKGLKSTGQTDTYMRCQGVTPR